jgi:hypothetical protein
MVVELKAEGTKRNAASFNFLFPEAIHDMLVRNGTESKLRLASFRHPATAPRPIFTWIPQSYGVQNEC